MSIAPPGRPAPVAFVGEVGPPRPTKRFDRSSFEGDFMVVIPGQTPEDFEEFAPEGHRCEFFDGVIYMPSPVAEDHQDHVGFLHFLFYGSVAATGVGKVAMGPGVLRLSETRKPEPDLFIRPAGADEWDPRALLVVEVLSPSTRIHDLQFKRAIYEEAGIPEVWYVDDRDRSIIVVRRVGDAYRAESIASGVVAPPSVPGLWIDAAWLWADPRPNPRACLDAILAGVPG